MSGEEIVQIATTMSTTLEKRKKKERGEKKNDQGKGRKTGRRRPLTAVQRLAVPSTAPLANTTRILQSPVPIVDITSHSRIVAVEYLHLIIWPPCLTDKLPREHKRTYEYEYLGTQFL